MRQCFGCLIQQTYVGVFIVLCVEYGMHTVDSYYTTTVKMISPQRVCLASVVVLHKEIYAARRSNMDISAWILTKGERGVSVSKPIMSLCVKLVIGWLVGCCFCWVWKW